mmetsp:Transcript_3673/g.4661  ORF Transcript_3673/g.4661 Transcript_3673/m.4661 type:complete len:88 (+) Transcript_3673:552-815(+)
MNLLVFRLRQYILIVRIQVKTKIPLNCICETLHADDGSAQFCIIKRNLFSFVVSFLVRYDNFWNLFFPVQSIDWSETSWIPGIKSEG